jgi:signal transduction histidine kinase
MTRDPGLLMAVDEALATRQLREVELHKRVPVERRLLATLAPLDHPRSAIDPSLLISFRDLTEQDRLARMRADFVANASHELRTPLASLRGFVETLQGAAKNDTEARERFLKVMSEQAERMSRLVDDLLSLSRVKCASICRRLRTSTSTKPCRMSSRLCSRWRRGPQPPSNSNGWTRRLSSGDRDELVHGVPQPA